jgi:hypothetical protein
VSVAPGFPGRVWGVGTSGRQSGSPIQTLANTVCAIVVQPSGFANPQVRVMFGQAVYWRFDAPNGATDTVTDSTSLGLYDSGKRGAGGSFVHQYLAAGSYGVTDEATGNAMMVRVSMQAPDKAAIGDGVPIAWASRKPPSGMVYDVQVLVPNTKTWQPVLEGTTATGLTYKPSQQTGTYSFRSRLRSTQTNAATGWSPPSITTVE